MFYRAEAFSGILTDLPKQKLATIKLNNVRKIYNNFENLKPIFSKRLTLFQNKTKEHYRQISKIRISLGTKFRLKQTIVNFWPKFTHKG